MVMVQLYVNEYRKVIKLYCMMMCHDMFYNIIIILQFVLINMGL